MNKINSLIYSLMQNFFILLLTLISFNATAQKKISLSNHNYEFVILNGRVVYPESKLDALRNIGITKGTIQTISTKALKGNITIKAKRNDSLAFTFPPEWEPHEAMWIDWTDFAYDTRIEMIKALYKNVKIKLLTFSDSLQALAVAMMHKANIDTSRVQIYYHPVPNYFLRDAGIKYLTNGKSYQIADFGWNCFGHSILDNTEFDSICYQRGNIDNDLAKQFGIPVKTSNINVEGGALDVSSSVIMAFKEMALDRNPGKSLQEIEKAFLDMYGKKKMIWIDSILLLEKPGRKVGNIFGQGANGHIDDYMRFVNDSTIMVGVISAAEKNNNPINKIDYPRLQHNLKQIKQATDINGKPFHIVEIPMPDVNDYAWRGIFSERIHGRNAGFYEGSKASDSIVFVPIMSYLNFTITNGIVLINKYWHKGIPESEKKKDEFVYATMKKLFPGRKIVQINSLPLNWGGGGMHCATQQVPKLN